MISERRGGAGQCPTGRKAAATTRCFSSYLPRPNATLFVVTGPLVHDAMSVLVPDRWIFVVKACCVFPCGWEWACHFKSNIPRKIPVKPAPGTVGGGVHLSVRPEASD